MHLTSSSSSYSDFFLRFPNLTTELLDHEENMWMTRDRDDRSELVSCGPCNGDSTNLKHRVWLVCSSILFSRGSKNASNWEFVDEELRV